MANNTPETLVVSSADRVTGNSNDFRINLKEPITNVKKISLISCYIPNSTYNIRLGVNDTINFRESGAIADEVATLTPGAYNSTTLAIEIATQLTAESTNTWTYTCGYSGTSMKFTISAGGVHQFALNFANGTNQAYRQMGFTNANTSTATTQTSINVIDLGYPKLVFINISELNNRTHSTVTHAMSTFALNVNSISSYYIQFSENIDYYYVTLNSPSIIIPTLTISLRDEAGKSIDLNGAEWTLTLRIEH